MDPFKALVVLVGGGVVVAVLFFLRRLFAKPPLEVAEVYSGPFLPSFDPSPRRDTILAAGRYHWKMDIVYINYLGAEESAVCAAPESAGIARHKITSMDLVLAGGITVPLNRIKSIEVRAASQDARDRYRVRG